MSGSPKDGEREVSRTIVWPMRPPSFVLSDGAIECLKWLALLSMTLDHFNKHWLNQGAPAMFAAGRLAMPLFAFILGYNLARVRPDGRRGHSDVLNRLLIFGAVATIPYTALGKLIWFDLLPLNILFALAVSVGVISLLERRGRWTSESAVLLFVLGGALVEFWWPAVGLCVCVWAYCRQPRWGIAALWLLCMLLVAVINQNLWAFAMVPIVWAASKLQITVPRCSRCFYFYYPLHLAVLWFGAAYMGLQR